ncbi:MAG: histidine kinase [Rikenellaceae bacterium]
MKKLKIILPHILSWGVALFIAIVTNINFVEFDQEQRSAFFQDNMPIWCVYVVFFYLCYLLIIPKTLFKKRYVAFPFTLIILFLGSFFIINREKTDIYKGFLKERIIEVSNDHAISADRAEHRVQSLERRLVEVESHRNSINIFAPHSSHTSYTLFFVFVVALGITMLRKWQEYQRAAEEARQRQMESELSYLKQQINPHFLFNALNSIYSLIISTSPDAGDAVLKLSAILRYMLYETDKTTVSLSKELDMINDYLSLQKLKCTSATKVTFVYNGDVDNRSLPPLILIPFIENAFKYGSDNVHDSFIDISIAIKENTLFFEVQNRIVCPRKESVSSGIGIANIKRRLELIYHDKYLLTTKEHDDIFFVSLQIPINNISYAMFGN